MGFYATEPVERRGVGNEKRAVRFFRGVHRRDSLSCQTKSPANKAFHGVVLRTTAPGVPLYGYRHLSTELGRWVSRDPIGDHASFGGRKEIARSVRVLYRRSMARLMVSLSDYDQYSINSRLDNVRQSIANLKMISSIRFGDPRLAIVLGGLNLDVFCSNDSVNSYDAYGLLVSIGEVGGFRICFGMPGEDPPIDYPPIPSPAPGEPSEGLEPFPPPPEGPTVNLCVRLPFTENTCLCVWPSCNAEEDHPQRCDPFPEMPNDPEEPPFNARVICLRSCPEGANPHIPAILESMGGGL